MQTQRHIPGACERTVNDELRAFPVTRVLNEWSGTSWKKNHRQNRTMGQHKYRILHTAESNTTACVKFSSNFDRAQRETKSVCCLPSWSLPLAFCCHTGTFHVDFWHLFTSTLWTDMLLKCISTHSRYQYDHRNPRSIKNTSLLHISYNNATSELLPLQWVTHQGIPEHMTHNHQLSLETGGDRWPQWPQLEWLNDSYDSQRGHSNMLHLVRDDRPLISGVFPAFY